MNLEKAKEILEKHGIVDEQTTWGDYLEAVQLGTEALQRLIDQRLSFKPINLGFLPGETKE